MKKNFRTTPYDTLEFRALDYLRKQLNDENLIDDDFFAILDNGDHEYLYHILHGGFKGYNEMTDNELAIECDEREISAT